MPACRPRPSASTTPKDSCPNPAGILDYDRAYGLDPNDPRLGDLAQRIVAATRSRYGPGDLPGQVTGSAIPALIQESINASSPAWQRLDTLIRAQLRT